MTTTAEPEPRLIKRYANRKMYDTVNSCYVTLEQVAAMVRDGEDVRVIDNKTKDDLTEVTLTQVLLDSKRKKRGAVSIQELKRILASGSDYLQQRISEPVSRVQRETERKVERWRDETEKTVGKWRDEAEKTMGKWRGEEGAEGEPLTGPTLDAAETADATHYSIPQQLAQPAAELSKSVDARVRHLFAKWAASREQSQTDQADDLTARIRGLEARVAVLESALQAAVTAAPGPAVEASNKEDR